MFIYRLLIRNENFLFFAIDLEYGIEFVTRKHIEAHLSF